MVAYMTQIDEIAPEIFRISTFSPEAGMQFNQFLILDDEPLLYHTGLKGLFPAIRESVSSLIDLNELRWIGFSHFESDECGSLNKWLEIAPQAKVVTGLVGASVNINDFAIRPPRIMQDNEVFSTGKKHFRYLRTPHVLHGWDAGLLYEESDQTLFTSDLFHQNGDVEPITRNSLVESSTELLQGLQQSPFAHYIPYSPAAEQILLNLARLQPRTLAIMHGSSFTGDGKKAIEEFIQVWKDVLS
jgi:flavorubredoxin